MRTKTTKALFGLILLQLSTSVFAKCMRTPDTANVYWPTDWPPVDTDAGIVKSWVGAGSGGGGLNMGRVNLLSDSIQPIGEIIANGGPVPITQFGDKGGFDPEQILFVCTPDEEPYLYEGFIFTDTVYHGNTVTDPMVPEHTNTTYVKKVGVRALHVDTGKYFTTKWQLKRMDGLDRDKYGRLLVKAKNFSAVQLEYVKIANPTPAVKYDGTEVMHHAPNSTSFGPYDPFGWTFLVSHHPDNPYERKIPNCREGQHKGQCSPWAYYEWVPGTLGNKNAHLGGDGGGGFTSYKGCIFSQVTPSVVFDSISASELEAGEYRSGKIEVIYECENGANFGTSAGTNAIGFKVNNFAKSVAEHFGLLTSGNGVKKLFSDAYFRDDFAKGVGIELFSSGSQTPMNWLTIDSRMGNGNVDGWYGITGDRLNSDSDPIGIYRAEYDVKLSKFSPVVSVSPGKVIAIAEVVVSIQ